jgi:sec-independent protein translocase protein TatA
VVGDILQPTHLLLVLVVALLVLGPKRLPEVARHLGSGIRDFRDAISGEHSDRTEINRTVTPDTTPPEAVQTHAVASEPAPVVAEQSYAVAPEPQPVVAQKIHAVGAEPQPAVNEPGPPVMDAIPEPETKRTDAVVAEPEPEDAGPAPDQTPPLGAPEHPSPAPDAADAATTQLSSQRPT